MKANRQSALAKLVPRASFVEHFSRQGTNARASPLNRCRQNETLICPTTLDVSTADVKCKHVSRCITRDSIGGNAGAPAFVSSILPSVPSIDDDTPSFSRAR